MSHPGWNEGAWEEYLAAARRLDALRRGALPAEDDPTRAATATFEELTRVRARLAVQHTRLRAWGVPEGELHPSLAELAAEARAEAPVENAEFPADGPGTVWAALRRSRAAAEEADAVLSPPGGWSAVTRRIRTLLRRFRRSA